MRHDFTPTDVATLACYIPYYYLMEKLEPTTILQGLSTINPSPVTATWLAAVVEHCREESEGTSWYRWQPRSPGRISRLSRAGTRTPSPVTCASPGSHRGSHLTVPLHSTSPVGLSLQLSPPPVPVTTEVSLLHSPLPGLGEVLPQSPQLVLHSREESPPRGISAHRWTDESTPTLTHFVVFHPTYYEQYVMVGGDIEMSASLPQSTLEVDVNSEGESITSVMRVVHDSRRGTTTRVTAGSELDYALLITDTSRESLLERWSIADISASCLSSMVISKLPITSQNLASLTHLLETRRGLLDPLLWSRRVVRALDLHLLPRVVETARRDVLFDRSVLVDFLSLFPKAEGQLELVNTHGISGLLGSHGGAILRYLGGIAPTVKLSPRQKVELVDAILGDREVYRQYLVETNRRHLKLYRDTIPWVTALDVDNELLEYPPHDIVWYCGPDLTVRGVLRNGSHIRGKRLKDEVQRLNLTSERAELPNPMPFTRLLDYLLEQLEQISLT